MIEEKLVYNLRKNKLTISSVESCTGGYLINKITNVEGASSVTNGGLVAYSNAQKIRAGVPAKVIEQYGVYSIECAEIMGTVGLDMFSSDICIGVTGTLSNIDINNRDSEQGKVFYSIRIKINNEILSIKSTILIPIIKRDLQKAYIVNNILERVNKFLEDEYIHV